LFQRNTLVKKKVITNKILICVLIFEDDSAELEFWHASLKKFTIPHLSTHGSAAL
jgi:hypothetical protein